MKRKLSIFLIIILSLSVCSCGGEQADAPPVGAQSFDGRSEAILRRTSDAGWEYIDSFVFLGESTTYHLKSRGVLREGTDTKQVWAPRSGTLCLDATVTTVKLVYPETGELLTVREATARKRPRRILLCFGLNGAVGKIRRGKEAFLSAYLSLINEIRRGCADTQIILQACFPIARDMDTHSYGVDAETLSEYIRTLNEWSLDLAYCEGLPFLNTAETLTDADGFLRGEYDAGDGHHLNTDAYTAILEYIRTHEDR